MSEAIAWGVENEKKNKTWWDMGNVVTFKTTGI